MLTPKDYAVILAGLEAGETALDVAVGDRMTGLRQKMKEVSVKIVDNLPHDELHETRTYLRLIIMMGEMP